MTTAPITYEPHLGQDISDACRKAIALANKNGSPVAFRFNDVDMVVSPGEGARTACDRWRAESERQAEAWRNSPKGKRAAAESEARRLEAQRETDRLIADGPRVVTDGLAAVVRWCAKLSMSADHNGINWEPRRAATMLIAAGYRENAHVGQPPEAFRDNRQMMGEYIIGQAINCLKRGMPPHPMTEHFAKEAGFLSRS
jgi:hypothetical protein